MAAQQDSIDQAIELAAKGAPKDGVQLLWPLVLDEATRDEALFALAYCFEKDGNICTAVYLYQWIVDHHPDSDAAAKRLDETRAIVSERGLTEDFEDEGHTGCPCGSFRQRAEYGACPYCGLKPGEDPIEKLKDAGRAAVERVQEWTESEELKPTAERLKILQEDVADRFRELSDNESVKRVTEKVGEVGREVGDRVKRFTESDTAHEAATRTRELGEDLSGRVKEFSEKPEVVETKTRIEEKGRTLLARGTDWIASDRAQHGLERVVNAIEGFLSKVQAQIDRFKK